DAAFKRSDNVYLVFSANKSGEYFGYVRMLAPISGDLAVATPPAPTEQNSPDNGPQSILTPATVTASSGRIINDSARGTIFWEADDLTEEDGSSLKETSDATAEQDLGRPFIIEWTRAAHKLVDLTPHRYSAGELVPLRRVFQTSKHTSCG
ncbi:hypothetical protein LTR95_011142, partial [Oleoguttula sp. CCFEE 5521]